MEMKECLEGGEVPEAGEDCDYCTYREAVSQITN